MTQYAESLRRLSRRVFGTETHGQLSRALCRIQALRVEGWPTYRLLYDPPVTPREVRSVQLSHYAHPMYFRPGTSDVTAIVQSIIRQEYGQLSPDFQPDWIVDGGSYIGDVTVYFLNRFPQCHILALEPNPASVSLARKNLEPYGERVMLYPKGLWSKPTKLSLSGDFFTAQLQEIPGALQVECVDLNTLMQIHNLAHLDLVKLDVEHAETEIVLNNSDEWLARTRLLIIEFHTPEIRDRCFSFLSQKGFRGFSYREVEYLFNSNLIP